MVNIVFKGDSDVRVITKGDFNQLGVEGVDDFTKTEFKRNEPTEVSAAVANAILSDARFGKFETHSDDTPLIEVTEANSAPAAKKSTASK